MFLCALIEWSHCCYCRTVWCAIDGLD